MNQSEDEARKYSWGRSWLFAVVAATLGLSVTHAVLRLSSDDCVTTTTVGADGASHSQSVCN